MTETQVHYGPRLNARPTGSLRRALLVAPTVAIEDARPLQGEPNAVLSRALSQLDVLAKTLRFFGADVTVLPGEGNDPYASAAADGAIVFEDGAAVLRPSAPGHRDLAAWVEHHFEALDVPIAGHIAAPGLLDGSDVLLAGRTAFIGASARSNSLGRAGFAQIARAHGFSAVEVPLASTVSSLRSVMGVCSDDTLVVAPRGLDVSALSGFKTIVTEIGEDRGAGVLNLGDHHVLADVRYPTVINALRKNGITVEAIDLYDFGRVGITPSMLVVDLKRT
jgi:dimethylargininase